MDGLSDGVRLRQLQAETLFDLTESGRLVRGRSPDRPVAPRLWIGGTADGNVVRLRVDVSAKAARAIRTLVAREPAMTGRTSDPVHLDDYIQLLSADARVEEVCHDRTYVFSGAPPFEHDTAVIRSQTPEGTALLGRLARDGMPADLADMGFRDAGDLWPPWCAAVEGGAIVSLAFTARVSPLAAEAGVATPAARRGRGLASAAVAEWAALPALEARVLFYTADEANRSSRRVADRLGLPLLGPSLSIR